MTSASLYERALRHVPGGVHSNTRFARPHPPYLVRASGAHVWDADGVRYLDCMMGNGSVMLGHAHPAVTDAVAKAVGAYHGWLDQVWVSTWPSAEQIGPRERPGVPPGSAGLSGAAGETVVVPFNDLETYNGHGSAAAALSIAHSDEDPGELLDAAEEAFAEMSGRP